MKKLIPSLVAAIFLSAIIPAHATLMVYGVINGVVTGVSYTYGLQTRVGMTVTGTFFYDYDSLSAPDASGNRTIVLQTSPLGNPNAAFSFSSNAGEGAGGASGTGLISFVVDANGLPYSGSFAGGPDGYFGPSSVVAIFAPGYYWSATVTYTITGVPDAGATWFLLCLALASVMVAHRCFRQSSPA
jgi:hypothetical protein